MTNINIILNAVRSNSPNRFNELFKPTTSSLSGECYTPRIVDLIKDAQYDMLDTEDLINIVLMETYLNTSDMYQFLKKSEIVYDCMFKIKNNIPFDQALNIQESTSGYVYIYDAIHQYLDNNPDKNKIEQAFLSDLNIIMNEKQSWARSLSNADHVMYLQFANTMVSKLETSQILYWLTTYSTNPILERMIPELDIYKIIPNKKLELYKVLGLSDAQCCVTYQEESQNKTISTYPLIQFDFN